ncbi:MAG: CopA family copper-resistance protein [Gammaproteobacteria bacterium]|jgi:CopA family copper-resistance protein
MSENSSTLFPPVNLTRRRFVLGVTGSSLLVGLGFKPDLLTAAIKQTQMGQPTLRGKVFDLAIGEQIVNFTGTSAKATTVNGSLPAPTLRFKEGDTVTLRVRNNLKVSSSIHWHGLILPSEMDGVPGISNNFEGIPPGESFTYQFKLVQSGTYWYHSHSGFQEQTGLYGSIIVDPVEDDPISYDREHLVMLSDWSDEDPKDIYSKLKKLSHYYNFKQRTHADLLADIKRKGFDATWEERNTWSGMRMSQRDLSDVTGYTYTYLMNGVTPNEGWIGLFNKGEKVRLRFVNGSAMTFFDLRIPGLKMTVVAADGQNVEPVTVDEIRLGVAETYDVIVEPDSDAAYTIFAQSIDRSGYARGTLTPDLSQSAEVPELDDVAGLTHSDMGMDMQGMDMKGMDHSQMDMPAMDNSQMDMSEMDHSQMDMPEMDIPEMDLSEMKIPEMDIPEMDHSQAGSEGFQLPSNPSDFSTGKLIHAKTEYGPHVDMRAADAQYRLSDPGVGLRNNGRKVLTYADLRNLHTTRNDRDPDRELVLHLTGNMGRYMWSINGVKRSDAEPLQWKLGERVRITFVNDTMMNHPMHLHGMWSDLETGDNDFLPRKHTVIVQPGARISYRVTVDAEGGWAYHCHLLYHMLGMFRTVNVS